MIIAADEGRAVRLYQSGFTDIVSVVPPGATISSTSKIRDNMRGKVPGLRKSDGTWIGYRGFTDPDNGATPEKAKRWDEWGANVGLLGNRFPGVDIDVDSEELAQLAEDIAIEVLGDAPVRHSRGARRLLPYRTEAPFKRLALDFEHEGVRYTVEVLCEGRQYLVAGTHPSGVEYRWTPRPLWELTPANLPTISERGVRTFLERLRDELETRGIECELDERANSTGEPPPQEELKAPSLEALSDLVAQIPNDYPSQPEYIRFMYAVRAAGADDPIMALGIFQSWAARWEDGFNDPEDVEHEFLGLTGPFRVGWHWLLAEARRNGVNTAALVFDVAPQPDEGSELTGTLRLAEGLSGGWEQLGSELTELQVAMSSLGARDRRIVEAAAVSKLRAHVGGVGEARRLLDSFATSSGRSAFVENGRGLPVLRGLRAEDLDIDEPYLVDGLIPEGAVGAIISGFSMGKTWLIIHLGLSVAFGRPWFGFPVKQRPVVYLIAEGNNQFPKRMFGWLVEHGLLPDGASLQEMFELLDGRVIINRYPTRFDDPDFEVGLVATVEDTKAGLVFIDTLGKTLGRDQPENDNDVANNITGMLSHVTARTNCTVVMTHHTGLAGEGRARGASAWEQGMDFAYLIKGSRQDLNDGDPVSLVPRKMRDGTRPRPIAFRLKRLPGLTMASGRDCEPAFIQAAVVEAARTPPAALPLVARTFTYIQTNPGSAKGAVCSGVVGGTEKVRGAILELEAIGAIENRGSDARHEWHAVQGWNVDGRGQVVNLKEVFGEAGPTLEASSGGRR